MSVGDDPADVFLDALTDPSRASPSDDYVIVGSRAIDGSDHDQVTLLYRGSSAQVAAALRRGINSAKQFDIVYCAATEDFAEVLIPIN